MRWAAGGRDDAGVQAADLPFPFSPHFPFARVGRVRPLLPHSPIPSPILTRNSFGACLLPTPRPPPVCVSLSRSASDGVLLGLLFTPCQQLHIMHKWNGYSCIRYSPLFSLMPVLPHFSTSSICHASISSFHPTPRRTVSVPAGRRNFPLHSNIESWRNSQTIIQWIYCLPRAQRARSTVGCTGEAADWVLALLPQSTSVIRSPARSGLRGRSTIVPCRSKTHSAVLSNFLSVSSRFIWPRSSAASFLPGSPPFLLLRRRRCLSLDRAPLQQSPRLIGLAFSGLSRLCWRHCTYFPSSLFLFLPPNLSKCPLK